MNEEWMKKRKKNRDKQTKYGWMDGWMDDKKRD